MPITILPQGKSQCGHGDDIIYSMSLSLGVMKRSCLASTGEMTIYILVCRGGGVRHVELEAVYGLIVYRYCTISCYVMKYLIYS